MVKSFIAQAFFKECSSFVETLPSSRFLHEPTRGLTNDQLIPVEFDDMLQT